MFDPSAVFYMEKLVTGPGGRRRRRHHGPGRGSTSAPVAKAKGARPRTSRSCILDRPRHDGIVREIRETGARIKFISDGDVAGAIMAAREGTGIDLLLGIGGTPEGIIAACAIKCLGGVIQGRLWPQDDEERQQGARRRPRPRPRAAHRRPGHRRQRASSSPPASPTASCCAASATAPAGPTTHSLVMRSAVGTIRLIESEHRLDKLRRTPRSTSTTPRNAGAERRMITVCGEAVADLVAQDDGDYRAYPGGSPANVALALARLGEATTFAGRLGPDVFGRRMRSPPHVQRRRPAPSRRGGPAVDARGRVVRRAAPRVLRLLDRRHGRLAVVGRRPCHRTRRLRAVAFHTGSLASWTPPGDTALKHLFARARAAGACTLSYDPNVRPRLLGRRGTARRWIEGMVALSHVVKVSDEDLAWLCPGEDVADRGALLGELGPGSSSSPSGPDGSVAARPGRHELVRSAGPGDRPRRHRRGRRHLLRRPAARVAPAGRPGPGPPGAAGSTHGRRARRGAGARGPRRRSQLHPRGLRPADPAELDAFA